MNLTDPHYPVTPASRRFTLQELQTYATQVPSILGSIRNPPCDCLICQQSFYTSQQQHLPSFSYHLIKSYMKDIHECMKYLADRLKKRSQQNRQVVLMAAAPYLADSPYFILFYCRNLRERYQLLAPWLNVDTLKTNPEVLFALLHYRVAYQPQDWAAFDSCQLEKSWSLGSFDIDFCDKHVIMYGPRYGTLVDWEEAAAHRADILGFPRARLVIEAQALILRTLRSIFDKILDVADHSLPHQTHKWLELTANAGFKRIGEVEYWSPYTNQAFSAPPLFDPDHLISLINTRLEASGDHLWHLQCDPTYMRRYIKIHSRVPNTKITYKNITPRRIGFKIYYDLMNHNWWGGMKAACEPMLGVHRQLRNEIYPGSPLPPRFENDLVSHWAGNIVRTLPVCPGFSHHWRLTCKTDTDHGPFANADRVTPAHSMESFENDPLDWLLMQLGQAQYQNALHDHAMLLSFIQDHLSRCSSKEKARLDEGVYQDLSELWACHEMLAAVRLSRPRFRSLPPREEKDRDDDASKRKHKLMRERLERIGKGLIRDFYGRPLSGQRNLEWLQQFRANRVALETFWDSMRDLCQEKLMPHTDKTQEYVDGIRSEDDRILADIERNEAEPMLRNLTLYDLGQTFKGEVQRPREKIKSRPESSGVQSTETTTLGNPIPAIGPESCLETNEAIAVDEQSLKLFGHMFPKTAEESAKTVGWNEFVRAICYAGFKARNNGVSAVLFESIDGGKIVFHKPHPTAKIDPIMLQSMGRRMTKWFGWNRGRFILASGSVDKPSC
ncbi:hypothetical protein F4806DRAFT_503257 [Annulohypoxylon nitens]|nr:hypothetical protein F4806DRAFT_503257 [Annulohypoxylon nitens]